MIRSAGLGGDATKCGFFEYESESPPRIGVYLKETITTTSNYIHHGQGVAEATSNAVRDCNEGTAEWEIDESFSIEKVSLWDVGTCTIADNYTGSYNATSSGHTWQYCEVNQPSCIVVSDEMEGFTQVTATLSDAPFSLVTTNQSGQPITNSYSSGWIVDEYGWLGTYFQYNCYLTPSSGWHYSTNRATNVSSIVMMTVENGTVIKYEPKEIIQTWDGSNGNITNGATTVWELSEPYETQQVIDAAMGEMTGQEYPDPETWGYGTPTASATLTEDEMTSTVSCSSFSWSAEVDPDQNYVAELVFHIYTNGGLYKVESVSEASSGSNVAGAGELVPQPTPSSVTFTLPGGKQVTAPSANASIALVEIHLSPVDDDGGKKGCGECETDIAGGPGPKLSSASITLGLGRNARGGHVGRIYFEEDQPSAELWTPSVLKLEAVADDIQVVQLNGYIRQIRAPETLVDVHTNDQYSYTISFYERGQYNPVLSGGLFTITGSPFVVWTIENPDQQNGTNRLQVLEGRDSLLITNLFTWMPQSNTWEFVSGNGLRKQTHTTEWNVDRTIRTETARTFDPVSGTVLAIESEKHSVLGIVEKTIGEGSKTRTTTYSYNSSGKLEEVVNGDGSWERYIYDTLGRKTAVYSSVTNATPTWNNYECRLKTYDYAPLMDSDDDGTLQVGLARTEVEYLFGNEVSRHLRVIKPGETTEVQCQQTGVATWNQQGNLATVTKKYISGPNAGRVQSILYPNQTLSLFEYHEGESGRTNVISSGEPNSTGTAIVDGSRITRTWSTNGQLLAETTIDIVSGFLTSSTTYTNHDAFNRARLITYMDGTTFETDYACCGSVYEEGRDGVVAVYQYDALKRKIATIRNGIITSNVLDAAGQLLAVYIIPDGSATAPIKQFHRVYDVLGSVVFETNAMGISTAFSETIDEFGATVRTTTYADGGTRIDSFYPDGTTRSILGTAVHPVRYEYGATWGSSFVKEIKLDAEGEDTSEWIVNSFTMTGQHSSTDYPDFSSKWSYYNDFGQLSKTVDPDGVATLYRYNSKGSVEYTVQDLNRNSEMEFDGNDRITQIERSVADKAGTIVNRTQTYIWPEEGQTNRVLISTSEHSVDGRKTWQTQLGRTNYSESLLDGALKITTNVAPDLSHTLTEFQNGRMVSVTRKDSAGDQLSQQVIDYDDFGRREFVTDAAKGTTRYTYDSANRITSTTAPAPNPGTSLLVTSNIYNNMGRLWKTILPDQTSVTNVYYLSGELKQTAGSRTYPVEYSYDSQGRMKTMTTWQGFSSGQGAAVTRWDYDPERGFLESKVYEGAPGTTDDQATSYGYTGAGRLESRVSARGVSTWYGYTYGGELAAIYRSGTDLPGVTTTFFEFDRLGRKKTVDHGGEITHMDYSVGGQLLAERYEGGPMDGLGITNRYDHLLRRTNLLAATTSASYAYGEGSRLQTVADGENSATYTYLSNSELVSLIAFAQNGTNRMNTERQYDALHRLTNIVSSTSAVAVASYQYVYNDASQRTRMTEADGSYWIYDYDSLGQVTSGKKYWSDGTAVAGQQFEYRFDDIGNRTWAAEGGDEWGGRLREETYAANLFNQYTSRTVPGEFHVLGSAREDATVTVNNQRARRKGEYFWATVAANNTSADYVSVTNLAVIRESSADVIANKQGHVFVPETPELFEHDLDGNLVSDGRWVYTWDGENRLIAMQSHASAPQLSKRRLEFSYDWQGRRIGKKVLNWDDSVLSETRFLYDGWNLVAELDTNNNLTRSYLWGLDLSGSMQGAGGVGGLLVVEDTASGTTNFVCYDGNGNVTRLVSAASCAVTAQYEYGPFGETIRATGPLARNNPFRFSTKYTDGETDLVYYGYRYQNPVTGRWLSRDPIEDGSRNLYQLLRNASSSFIDPDGRSELWITFLPPPPPAKPSEIDCSGYTSLKGSSCTDCGTIKKDGYPEQAQTFCDGFKDIYTGAANQDAAACVANCLVSKEKECQAQHSDCDKRNCCRLIAHVECYASCFFVWYNGMPDGAWDWGWSNLKPACVRAYGPSWDPPEDWPLVMY